MSATAESTTSNLVPAYPYQLENIDRAIETLVEEICGNPECPVEVREDVAALKAGCKVFPNQRHTPGSFWWHVVTGFEWTYAWRTMNRLPDAWASLYRLRVLADRDFLLFAM